MADFLDEMRIGEKEEKRKCQPGEREKGKEREERSPPAGGQLLQSPFASKQHLGGSAQQLANAAVGGFNSSKGSILNYLSSQEDSVGQGCEVAQINSSGRDGGEEAGLARREGIKKRSKSLKCNKVN